MGEVDLPKINPVKADLGIDFKPCETRRDPVAVSLGPVLKGISMPHPDMKDQDTTIGGVAHRFARKPPEPNKRLLKEFKRFVRGWCKSNLEPLQADTDISFETWILGTLYPLWRKEELKKKKLDHSILYDRKYGKVKSFVKDETYPEFKHARAINSRSDEFKCEIGPWFHAIEKEVFKRPEFIKKIPNHERPKYIMDRLWVLGAQYHVSDYTSFEALFTQELMDSCERVLYEHMTQHVPGAAAFMELVDTFLLGRNECRFSNGVKAQVKATRMSGEMCTSLGNGFSNLMFINFLTWRKGGTVVGVVEGDDGLFRVENCELQSSDFEELGLRIKLEKVDSLNLASFCGMIFHEDDLEAVVDPRRALANFGWGSKYFIRAKGTKLRSLLRCKALSMIHQYPCCPIVTALGHYGLRNTAGYDHRTALQGRGITQYWREQWETNFSRSLPERRPIPVGTRLLVEERWGISVRQQLWMEDYLDKKEDLEPLEAPFDFPNDWERFDRDYVTTNPDAFNPPPRVRADWSNLFDVKVDGDMRKLTAKRTLSKVPPPRSTGGEFRVRNPERKHTVTRVRLRPGMVVVH